MIELVFIVCLKTNPVACEEKVLSYLNEGGGPFACIARAQPELAAWSVEHPGFTIANWKCQDSEHHKVDI